MHCRWTFARDQVRKRAKIRDDDSCTPSITAAAAEIYESSMTEHLSEELILFLHMRKIGKPQEAQDNNGYKGDPALEFIKIVCAVLILDKNVLHDIQIMRRNLLKQVNVREFAPEAEFNKCRFSFTLPNVICSYCNNYRDLDLCLDRDLLTQEWRCGVPQCGQPYNREVMENGLLQIVC
ncbi:DNA polymerase epsilon catalytic subunit A [Tanacetum coccineum]